MKYLHVILQRDFNPLPPYGGRLRLYWIIAIVVDISIHSLRMEGDAAPNAISPVPDVISIHSLRMEGDLADSAIC